MGLNIRMTPALAALDLIARARYYARVGLSSYRMIKDLNPAGHVRLGQELVKHHEREKVYLSRRKQRKMKNHGHV